MNILVKAYQTINSLRILYNNRRISEFMRNRTLNRLNSLSHSPKLDKSQIRKVQEIYFPYRKINLTFHRFYTAATGEFHPDYMPDDFHYANIDPYFNNWNEAKIIDNKTLYYQIFADLRQPATIAYRAAGFWYDDKNQIIIPSSDILTILSSSTNFFIKKAQESYGGHGVVYIKNGREEIDSIESVLNSWETDIIIQKGVNQHPIMASVNPTSVNTMRIMTLLRKDGSVKVVSCILRMGINGSKVDNASSGGITVGVKKDGRLKNVAYSVTGKKFDHHPNTKVKFDSIIIPSFQEAVEMVSEQARKMPHFRLISWDVAIDYNNEPILIEANLRDGEIDFHQLNNGPLYGDETRAVLEEVFGK